MEGADQLRRLCIPQDILSPTLGFVGSKKHAIASKLLLTQADHHYLLLYFQQKTWGYKGTLTSTRTSLCWKPATPYSSLPASASVFISQVQRRRITAYHLCMSASTSIIIRKVFLSVQSGWAFRKCHRWECLLLPFLCLDTSEGARLAFCCSLGQSTNARGHNIILTLHPMPWAILPVGSIPDPNRLSMSNECTWVGTCKLMVTSHSKGS